MNNLSQASIAIIENLAFKVAPEDSISNPSYPNYTDTDIYVEGFTDAFRLFFEFFYIYKESQINPSIENLYLGPAKKVTFLEIMKHLKQTEYVSFFNQ